jgi:hypothetical protein
VTRRTRRAIGLRYRDEYQLTLPLMWSREEVRASLVVIRTIAQPDPVAVAQRVAKEAA